MRLLQVKQLNFLWIFASFISIVSPTTCRSKFGRYAQEDFNRHACSWCYYFLFPGYPLQPPKEGNQLVVSTNTTRFVMGTRLETDIRNATNKNDVCSTLSEDQCDRWALCCQSGIECCTRQLTVDEKTVNGTCQSTWDGYSCWQATSVGTTSHTSCPNFLSYSIPTRSAVKTCLSNGSWMRKGRHDWTDYTPCLNYEEYKISIFISIGCQIASLIFLIPSVLIFIRYKYLMHQHRIRIHVNFFLSFILSGVSTILWDTAVTYDRLSNGSMSNTLMFRNTGECKLLSFAKMYFTSTNFLWMFCEGLYLYRLSVNAFSPPKRLTPFYILGWGTPLIYTGAYSILRVTQADENCWAKSLGHKEWIIYTPNLMCLIVNIYFLCSILRILLTQLQVHPNEPSNFRKALRATFVLIPLFGVQLVVTIYRLPPESSAALYYERMSEFITNSQGFFISLIFCLCNGEVLSLLRRSWQRWNDTYDIGSKKINTTTSINMNSTVITRYNSEKHSPINIQMKRLKMEDEPTSV